MSQPTVTAIIAVRDGSPTIGDCLDAIAAQSYPVTSIMVVDDASTDDTVRLVRERRDPIIELIELADNVGPAEARNLALTRVTTDYVWIVDADCVPAPDCLATLCAAMSTDPAIGVVGGPNPQNPRTSTYAAAAFDFSNRYLVDRRRPDRRALCRGREHAVPARGHPAGRLVRSESSHRGRLRSLRAGASGRVARSVRAQGSFGASPPSLHGRQLFALPV